MVLRPPASRLTRQARRRCDRTRRRACRHAAGGTREDDAERARTTAKEGGPLTAARPATARAPRGPRAGAATIAGGNAEAIFGLREFSPHLTLVQLLDDGRLADGQARTAGFKNTVVIMTSNLGSDLIGRRLGFDADQDGGDLTGRLMALVPTDGKRWPPARDRRHPPSTPATPSSPTGTERGRA